MTVRARARILVGLSLLAMLAALVPGLPGLPGPPEARAATTVGTATSAPNCGVNTYRKPDGTRWRCTLGENFDGTRLNTNLWRVMTSDRFSYDDRPDCFVNDPDNVKVANGVLRLTARREASAFNCYRKSGTVRTRYSAGMVSTFGKWTQAYGRFEFRAKFPYTTQRGIQGSFWLWPDGASGATWPISGEIDVAEWYSSYPDRVIPYLHYGTSFLAPKSATTNNNCLVRRVQDWHTYVLEWTPQGIRIMYDGVTCLYRKGGGAPFNRDFMMAMFQGFGLGKNAPTSSTPAVSTTQIAWVRVWS
ncbi:MAG: glycoside hydrolase family 16 protein [Propionibacteriales bacterium]|nr:glycoside hydrolase family 16 protein [Propionibacteriales bacterium]